MREILKILEKKWCHLLQTRLGFEHYLVQLKSSHLFKVEPKCVILKEIVCKILEFEIFDSSLQRNFTAWQGVQTSLGVSFWKYCLNLELFSSDDFRYIFFCSPDVDISDFRHIPYKMMRNPYHMHGKWWQNMQNWCEKIEILHFSKLREV